MLETMLMEQTEEVAPEIEYRSKEEVLTELLGRFTQAEDHRKQYDEIATRCFKLYRVHQKEALDGRSNLHIPRVYEQVDTLRARMIKSFVSQRPYVEFIPKVKATTSVEDYEDSTRKADIASALVDMQMENNKIRAKMYDYITSLLIYPAGILGVGWKYDEKMVRRKQHSQRMIFDPFGRPMLDTETGMPIIQQVTEIIEQKEVAYDDNEIVNIDFYDFWPDPKGQCIDSCRYVFHREWLSREDIEEKILVLERANGGQAFNIDWEKIKSSSGLKEGRWERQSEVGLTPATEEDSSETDERMNLYEVLNYWEDERYALIINRMELAYDGPNPYWRHMSKPFVVASFEPLPNEFYGMSAVELVADLQEETNTHRNQRIDNVSLVMNRMFQVLRDADIDESELVSRPHGIIHVDSHDDIKPLQVPDVTASSYNEEQIVKLDMENTLGVPSVVRGVDSSRRETATEIVTKSSNAGLRFDVKIMLFEALGFNRLAKLMDLNNQQFIDDERLIRLVGEEGTQDWRLVNPLEIVGEFDYRPAGPAIDPAANKEIRRQQLSMMMETIMRTQNPYIDMYQLTKTWLESFDLRNTDKLLLSEDELQEDMMRQQMMQQQQQMMQGAMPPDNNMPGQGEIDPRILQMLMSGGGQM